MRQALPLFALVAFGLASWMLLGKIDAETLRIHHGQLRQTVDAHPFLAPFVAILVYAAAVAACLPIALWITLALGFAFGTVWGGILSVLGGTLGAALTFAVTRTSLGRPLRQWAGPWLRRAERGFQDGMWGYLLAVRLVPVMPAWITNTVPALLGVPLGVFLVTTALGIAPATFVLASVGAGLATVFAHEGKIDLEIMTDVMVLGPLVAIALLALIPMTWRHLRAARTRGDA